MPCSALSVKGGWLIRSHTCVSVCGRVLSRTGGPSCFLDPGVLGAPSYFLVIAKSRKKKGKKVKSFSRVRLFATPVDWRSSVHGIFQARVLEWVVISFSRGSSHPRDQTQVSHTVGRHFTIWAPREAQEKGNLNICVRHPATKKLWMFSVQTRGKGWRGEGLASGSHGDFVSFPWLPCQILGVPWLAAASGLSSPGLPVYICSV